MKLIVIDMQKALLDDELFKLSGYEHRPVFTGCVPLIRRQTP